ncbi:MAG: hypothetical protein IPJ65_06260 [Archangiaceae bacterium]|nr:hypothetical protein [Archangiaceae bacterium]
MAKGSKEKTDGRSALEAAFRAYEAGDMVVARSTARRVIASPLPDDQAAAKRVAKLLQGDDERGEVQAELVAQEIVKRTSPMLRPYLWALGGATAYLSLLVMAAVRYG